MKKHYYVKNKFRFVTFLSLIFILTLFMAGTAFGLDTAQETKDNAHRIIIVEQGDTLWEIAGEVKPKGYDTRKAVYEICQISETKSSEIIPGQELCIPYEI